MRLDRKTAEAIREEILKVVSDTKIYLFGTKVIRTLLLYLREEPKTLPDAANFLEKLIYSINSTTEQISQRV